MEPKSTGREQKVLEKLNAAARFCDRRIGWNRIGFLLSVAIIAIAAVVLYRILRNIDVRRWSRRWSSDQPAPYRAGGACSSRPAISR